jgi:hypothetical protein
MMTQQIMIIPVHTGGGGKLSEEEQKIMLGMFIFLNLVWLITWIISSIAVYRTNKKTKHDWAKLSYLGFRFDMLGLFMLDVFLGLAWLVIILIAIGKVIGNFL